MQIHTEYRGMSITEDVNSRMVCRFTACHPVRRAARDLETAQAHIDAYLHAQANRPAGVRIVAFETQCRALKTAGQTRHAQDRADAMKGEGGRFRAGAL